jgi:hypothetical protein
MNLNKKIGFLLDNGLSPNFISSMNEGQVNTIYNRLVESKKENKEGIEKITKVTTKITPDTVKQGATIEMPAGKTAVNIQQKPDGSIEIGEDIESDLDWVMKGRTQDPKQVGPDTDDGFDDYDDGTSQISEKFESKAQQGLFWARCNKCKSENCKWCKMAKEFSKSTSKKQYKKMPEKKHPEKTVKYKKKKKTNEEFTMANYFDKVASVYANNAMGKTVDSLTKEQFVKKHINKIVENNLRPTMKKRDLLKLIESEIKHKKGLNEDFYMGKMDEELDFDFMSDVETAPFIKPKIKPKRETEPEWEPDEDVESEPQAKRGYRMSGPGVLEPGIKEPKTKPKEPDTTPEWEPDEDEPIVPSPNVNPEPQAKRKKDFLNRFKDDFDRKMSRMDESTYKPINYRKF